MIKIEIEEEVADAEAMVDLLNHIATLVKDGYTKGYHPNWDLKMVEKVDEIIKS